MSRTTTALVVPELNGKFELQQVYLDDIQPDEVLVEIQASGICHTDLSCANGTLPCAPNAVLGHEGMSCLLFFLSPSLSVSSVSGLVVGLGWWSPSCLSLDVQAG